MIYRNDGFSNDRASTIPIGFILVIGILTLTLYVFQTSTVPDMNRDAEVDTHRSVRTDMMHLDAAISRTATTGVPQSSVIDTHVSYPLQLAPPFQPTTVFQTTGPWNATFENAVREGGASGSGWDGSEKTYQTRPIELVPNYHVHTTAHRIQSEYGIVHLAPNDAPNDTSVVVDSQTIVNDNQITLVTIDGDVAVSRRNSVVTTIEPNATATETVTVTNSSTNPVTLSLNTSMSDSQWDALLEDEMTTNGGHVQSVAVDTSSDPDQVTITFERNISYTVRLYEVELGSTRING